VSSAPPVPLASASARACPCGSKVCGGCVSPVQTVEAGPVLPPARPGTVDGEYRGSGGGQLGGASCTLWLRGAVFELACVSLAWQSAQPEYRNGTVTVDGSTLTLSSSRRYWKHGEQAQVIDRTPSKLTATLGKDAGGDTITGDLGAGKMVLRRW
jgi:hypothetical protein